MQLVALQKENKRMQIDKVVNFDTMIESHIISWILDC